MRTLIISVVVSCCVNFAIAQKADSTGLRKCYDYLELQRNNLIMDKDGSAGVREEVMEELQRLGCNFIDEPVQVVYYYFGQPQFYHEIRPNEYLGERYINTASYVVYDPPGTSTTGRIYLRVRSGMDYRIDDFVLDIIDE